MLCFDRWLLLCYFSLFTCCPLFVCDSWVVLVARYVVCVCLCLLRVACCLGIDYRLSFDVCCACWTLCVGLLGRCLVQVVMLFVIS